SAPIAKNFDRIKRKKVQKKVAQTKIDPAMMKHDKRKGSAESCIASRFDEVNDTNIGTDLIDRSRSHNCKGLLAKIHPLVSNATPVE
ncbi:hypothetical protein KI387_030569, partial [Taxus chinensis]